MCVWKRDLGKVSVLSGHASAGSGLGAWAAAGSSAEISHLTWGLAAWQEGL